MIYHHTDTIRLPHILHTGELRPGRSTIGDYPDPDFLWATTDPRGDKSAAGHGSDSVFRQGGKLMVRFTLHESDFVPWTVARLIHPAWSAHHVERLERRGRQLGSDPSTWWCRTEELLFPLWYAVDTRSYSDPVWRPFDAAQHLQVMVSTGGGPKLTPLAPFFRDLPDEAALAVTVGAYAYVSARHVEPGRPTKFRAMRLPLEI